MAPVEKPLPPSEPEKQTQKAILKRHVDLAGPMVRYFQDRCSMALKRSSPWLQPTMAGALQMMPPEAYPDVPSSSLTTQFAATTQNKTRCALHCARFSPDCRRMMTGDNAGGISVWSSTDFGYMQYLQVHNKAVRDINFTHNGNFVLACDDSGSVKISSINLKPLQDIDAHNLPVRAVSASPTDQMFATCSDDNSVKVWDLATSPCASTTFAGRSGHGGEVRCVDWHPCTSLLASCGRDAMVKLWDARLSPDTAMLATLQGHKQTVNKVSWNLNGTWLASCSRDMTLKVWDVRHTKRELVSWQGHQYVPSGIKEHKTNDISCLAWHPVHLELLATAGMDGCINFWLMGQPDSLSKVDSAHDCGITAVAFHAMGHIMATSSGDAVSKFWVRPRPGDPWKGSQQKEQEEYAAMLAKLTPGLQQGQLPGLAGAAAAAGAGGGGPGRSTLPGGISIQQPGAQQGGMQQGPVISTMGQAPPGGRIPGLPVSRSMPPGTAGVPGLAPSAGPGMPGLPGPPGAGRGGHGMAGPPPAAAAGGAAGARRPPGPAVGQRTAGRGRGPAPGRGPIQPVYGGVKRPREEHGTGYEAAAAHGHFPGPPQQQQHLRPHMQHQHQHQLQQQQQHVAMPMQPLQQQHVPRPQAPPGGPPLMLHLPAQHFQQQQQQHQHVMQPHMGQQQQGPMGGRGFAGPPGGPGRGFGPPGAGHGPGRGQYPPHPGGRGEMGGRAGGRGGFGRGYGRGRQ